MGSSSSITTATFTLGNSKNSTYCYNIWYGSSLAGGTQAGPSYGTGTPVGTNNWGTGAIPISSTTNTYFCPQWGTIPAGGGTPVWNYYDSIQIEVISGSQYAVCTSYENSAANISIMIAGGGGGA